jgi:hypothetical protein
MTTDANCWVYIYDSIKCQTRGISPVFARHHPCSGAVLVKVRIIEATKGEIDGFDVGRLHVGFFYDLPLVLAAFLICEGWAEPIVSFLNLESSAEPTGQLALGTALGPFRRIF